jgi:hypothetical protein
MKELTVVCCVCKKHYRGPAPVPGVPYSSGNCPPCHKIEMEKVRKHLAERRA